MDNQRQKQRLILERQDELIDELARGTARVKDIALSINEEIKGQDVIINDINDNIDVADGKLKAVTRKTKNLIESTSNNCWCWIILFLAVVLIILIIVLTMSF